MFESILVCLDGSPMAEQIIPLVKNIVNKKSGKLILLRVVDTTNTQIQSLPFSRQEDIDNMRGEALNYLKSVAAPLSEKRINVECQVIQSKPAESIVEFGEKNRVELIALTTHGEGGLGRLVFGSTAVYVLRESKRPTLIIKPQRLNR